MFKNSAKALKGTRGIAAAALLKSATPILICAAIIGFRGIRCPPKTSRKGEDYCENGEITQKTMNSVQAGN